MDDGEFIAREVQALKQLRRISTSQGGPGSLTLDPDLPPTTSSPTNPSPLSPQAPGYWSAAAAAEPTTSDPDAQPASEDSSHLFWVPAHLHPELAPAEFRAFLKEHARAPPEGEQDSTLSRSNSSSSVGGLGRRKSMLSRQYTPAANDGIEEEKVVSVSRRRSNIYGSPTPQLTIGDLQKLDELAEEASVSGDPSKLRSVLRRSLSMNVSPSLVEGEDVEDADSPIIVPRPGQILRRAARTKIRKPGLAGDGGGHRFPNTRRGAGRSQTLDSGTRPSSDMSSVSDHGEDPYIRPQAPTGEIDDDDSRPVSFSEEASIFDSYADRRDSYTSVSTEEEEGTRLSSSPPSALLPTVVLHPKSPPLEPSTGLSLDSQSPPRAEPTLTQIPPPPQQPAPQPIPQQPVLYHPTPQRGLVPPSQSPGARTPSPDANSITPSTSPDPSQHSPSVSPPHETARPAPPRKEKEKKSTLWKWGSSDKDKDKDRSTTPKGKKNKSEKDKDKEKEQSSGGFFGFFGKKKHEEPASSNTGPATAAAIGLKPKPFAPPSPQYAGAYARYPIHVERAVYRLSHIKLANPRRPLYEQVLISNLMFWYLGVINKAQTAAQQQVQAAQQAQQAALAQQQQQQQEQEQAEQAPESGVPTDGPPGLMPQPPVQDQESLERERLEQEARERAEQEQAERERVEHERLERERLAAIERAEQERAEQEAAALAAAAAVANTARKDGRRKSLTKEVKGGGRRAEMPVRGPQYDVQHRAMEQDMQYHGYGTPRNGPAVGGPASPIISNAPSHHGGPYRQASPAPSVPGQTPTPTPQPERQFYPQQQAYGLPPGAMPPAPVEQSWASSTTRTAHQSPRTTPLALPSGNSGGGAVPPSPTRRSRSPPPRPPREVYVPPLPGQANKLPIGPGGQPRVQGRSMSVSTPKPDGVTNGATTPQANGNGKPKRTPTGGSKRSKSRDARPTTADAVANTAEEDQPFALWQQAQQAQARGEILR